IGWDVLFVDITGRKEAEERAAQAYRWLTEAIDSLSDGFALWDAEDRLVLWNEQFLIDHPQRDLLRKTGLEFSTFVERSAQYMRSEMDEDHVAGWIVDRLQHHQEARGATELQSASGRWLLLTERRTNEGYTVGIYTDITERRRSEDDLHASEERYRRLVQLSPDAILVDRGGVIVFANETAARMFGVADPDELIGTPSFNLAEEDDRVALASRRSRLKAAEQTAFERYRYIRGDGSIGNCESAVSSITWGGDSAVLIVIRDIENRIEAERQQALFGAVLHDAADSIEIADDSFALTFTNPAFEKMSGYSSDEVVGKRPADLFRPEGADTDIYDLVEKTLRMGQPWSGVLRSRRKDGDEYDQEVSVSPVFNDRGVIENYVAIKRGITQRLETQRALTE
ncbi:unnamed protein product, partial [Laminaria digitata]